MKKVNELTDYINKWLRNHKFYCKTNLSEDFQYEEGTKTIYYSLIAPEEGFKYFQKFADAQGLKYDCDNFLLAFMHELGHYKTIEGFDELDAREKLNRRLEGKKVLKESDYYKYYSLPEEFAATMWAVEFINKHPKMIGKFWENIQKIILEIYKVNEVDLNG